MILNLESLEGIPEEYLNELNKQKINLKQFDFFDQHLEDLEDLEIKLLVKELNQLCLQNQIIGFHYTNAIESDFFNDGIKIRSGQEIRDDFIKRFFHLFNKEEQNSIQRIWAEYFDEKQENARGKRIFFNFTKSALYDGGAELLLTYYGGEQIYFPIISTLPDISNKLKSIGKPMILKCILDPNELNTFYENPWGKIIISSFIKRINPNHTQYDIDRFTSKDVKPENIEVIDIGNRKYHH